MVNNSTILNSLSKIKVYFVSAYARKLSPIISGISDVDVLRKLNKEISILNIYDVSVQMVKGKINNRIGALNGYRRFISSKQNNDKIAKIINGIIDGSMGYKGASEILQEHVQELVNGRATAYKLSFSDEKERVKMQIKSEIAKSTRAIKNPIESVKQSAMLFECGYVEALSAVVKNLYSNEKYNEARELIEYFRLRDDNPSKIANSYERLEKEVICAEIGKCIKQVVTKPRYSHDDEARKLSESRFMQTIYRRIQNSGLRTGAIPLGKTEDKTRDIVLRDIWPESIEQGLLR